VDTVDELAATLDTMRTTFLMVGAVTLLVGVIGILNIGLATLNERAVHSQSVQGRDSSEEPFRRFGQRAFPLR
jgi:hypothetical protein